MSARDFAQNGSLNNRLMDGNVTIANQDLDNIDYGYYDLREAAPHTLVAEKVGLPMRNWVSLPICMRRTSSWVRSKSAVVHCSCW